MFGKTKKLVMCQACRGLIDSSLRTCPLCGRDSVPDAPARVSAAAQHSQFFTMFVLGITVVIYVLMTAVDMSSGGTSGAIVSGASPSVLIEFGARFTPLIRAGQWWRLVTPIFIHFGILHIGFNCFALYQIGPLVEEAYGSQKFIYVYIVTGIVGNVVSLVWAPQGLAAGASGAIMGLIGVTAVYGHKIGGIGGRSLTRQMIIWVVVIFVFGFAVGGIDNAAHLGGLLSGAGIGYIMRPEQPTTARAASLWNGVAVGCVVVIAASFAMIVLHYGDWSSKAQNFALLQRRVGQLERPLADSLKWRNLSDGDPKKIAADLKSASADLSSVGYIDETSNSLKQELVAIANRRAQLLEDADKNPAPLLNSTRQDDAAAGELDSQFATWYLSTRNQYGQ